MQTTYLVAYVLTVIVFMWLANHTYNRLSWLTTIPRMMTFLVIIAVGFIVGIYGPLRQARVLADTEILSHRPHKMVIIIRREPGQVCILIGNADGEQRILDIDPTTRLVGFSGVFVPTEIPL